MKHAATLCLVLLSAGCAAHSTYRAPATVLERRVFLEEIDEYGTPHPISSGSAVGRRVHRVPLLARVDENSTIRVAVHPATASTDTHAVPGVAALRPRLLETRKLLTYLAQLKEAHARALTTLQSASHIPLPGRWNSPAFARFETARRELGKLDEGLVDALDPLWPEGTPGGDEVDALLRTRMTQPDKFQAFINAEIGTLEQELQRVEDAVKSRGATLRLEAFLQRRGSPTAIHLDGYDTIEQLALEHHDRFGVDLTESQRLDLLDVTRGSHEVADAAERVRTGELRVSEAFAKVASSSGQMFGPIVIEGDSLHALLTSAAVTNRANRIKTAMATLQAEVAAGLSTELNQRWRSAFDSATALVMNTLSPTPSWRQTERLLAGVSGLRSGNRSPEDLVIVATGLAPTLRSLKSAECAQLRAALANVVEMFEQRMGALPEGLRLVAIMRWDASPAKAELVDLVSFGLRLEQFTRGLGEMAGLLAAVPGQLPVSVPEAFNVPFEGAPETAIQLQLTPREQYDKVTLRASLVEGNTRLETTSFGFIVERYGYWARLEPSIVVAYPYQLDDDRGRFAPAVSWLHGYRPRPESGGLNTLVRVLSPSAGIHASFLDFGTSADKQIGLGGTIALWKGALQAGYGWNILARSAEDGERYFFVGSSLIALLHGDRQVASGAGTSQAP